MESYGNPHIDHADFELLINIPKPGIQNCKHVSSALSVIIIFQAAGAYQIPKTT